MSKKKTKDLSLSDKLKVVEVLSRLDNRPILYCYGEPTQQEAQAYSKTPAAADGECSETLSDQVFFNRQTGAYLRFCSRHVENPPREHWQDVTDSLREEVE